MVDLDARVQATGGSALATANELLQQRHATRNVEAATQVIRQVSSFVCLCMSVCVCVCIHGCVFVGVLFVFVLVV